MNVVSCVDDSVINNQFIEISSAAITTIPT